MKGFSEFSHLLKSKIMLQNYFTPEHAVHLYKLGTCAYCKKYKVCTTYVCTYICTQNPFQVFKLCSAKQNKKGITLLIVFLISKLKNNEVDVNGLRVKMLRVCQKQGIRIMFVQVKESIEFLEILGG